MEKFIYYVYESESWYPVECKNLDEAKKFSVEQGYTTIVKYEEGDNQPISEIYYDINTGGWVEES